MAVDLHLHSRYSDGSDEPEAIVAGAAQLGLSAVALTDHDNLDGITRAADAADAAGIAFIPGTELSVEWSGGAMHLLVYFLEPVPGPLQDELAHIQQGRNNRNLEMVDRLNQLGLELTYDEVAATAGEGVVGRPHFAAALMKKGYVGSIAEAFDVYLAAGKPGYIPRLRLAAQDAIELATASGAVTSVAHPHTLGVSASDYDHAFSSLQAIGLGGIEAYYAEYTRDIREHLAQVASGLGMIATGGSDYHGTFKPGLDIGVGHGDLVVPDAAAVALVEARDSIR